MPFRSVLKPFQLYLASILLALSTPNLAMAIGGYNKAVNTSCQSFYSGSDSNPQNTGIKAFFVNRRASKAELSSQNEFQSRAISFLRQANIFSQKYYKLAAIITNEYQLEFFNTVIHLGSSEQHLWTQLEHVNNPHQISVLDFLLSRSASDRLAYGFYLQNIIRPEQIEIFKRLVESATVPGLHFWSTLNDAQIKSGFEKAITRNDIVAFSQFDGIPASISKELQMTMLRFSKRDRVRANVLYYSNNSSFQLRNGSAYAMVETRIIGDRIRIVVHEMNIDHDTMKYKDLPKGLNLKASEFMATIMLIALKKLKDNPGVHEIELLAQNIVNDNLVDTIKNRIFHNERRREDIPNYSRYPVSGTFLRASLFNPALQFNKPFSLMSAELLVRSGFAPTYSQNISASFTNVHQYRAIREVILGDRKNIGSVGPYIAQFNNPHQVSALQVLIDSTRIYDLMLPVIAKFTNEHQVKALNYVIEISGINLDLYNKLLLINNRFQAEAIQALVENKVDLAPRIDQVISLKNEAQLISFQRFVKLWR